MKEWNPNLIDDFNNPMREYDIYLKFIDELKTIKQIQPETIIVERYIFEEIERIIKNKFIDEFNEAREKLKIKKIMLQNNYDNFSHYQIYYNFMDRSIYVEPYYEDYKSKKYETENKEENNMLKILENYQIKKETEIENKYDKQLKDLENSDTVTLLIKETEKSIKEMLNSENVRLVINSDVFEFTKETVDKRNEIINTIREEKQKLRTKISEIVSLLELAPNYEEKLQILRDYDIMDKKKNIIL